MIELYCKDGVIYTDIAMNYEAIEHIMTNNVVRDNVSSRFSLKMAAGAL